MERQIVLWITFLCVPSVLCFEDVTLAEYFESSSYTFLKSLIEQSNMEETLSQPGPFTVFAPVDSAFVMLGSEVLDDLSAAQRKYILEYHIVEGYVITSLVESQTECKTLLGETIIVEPANGTVLVNNETYIDTNEPDVFVQNGVIQPVDTVMLPPDVYLTSLSITQMLLLDDAQFNDLFLALMVADLVNLLESGDFTVFAPTNEAFVRLQTDLADPSSEDAAAIYREVFMYHIVPGGRRASQLSSGTLNTLQGTTININVDDNGITVNGTMISTVDIYANNGVIHAIDDILFPNPT